MLNSKDVERWYKKGFWTEQMILNAVSRKALTQEQADKILIPPEAVPETIPVYPDMEGTL